MKDKEGDHIIKKKLESYEADLSKMDWNSFKKKLHEAEAVDTRFDEGVKSKLDAFTSTYEVEHWLSLRDELIRKKEVRKHIHTLKSMEMLLAVLLLFLFYSLFNVSSPQFAHQPYHEKYPSVVSMEADISNTDNSVVLNESDEATEVTEDVQVDSEIENNVTKPILMEANTSVSDDEKTVIVSHSSIRNNTSRTSASHQIAKPYTQPVIDGVTISYADSAIEKKVDGDRSLLSEVVSLDSKISEVDYERKMVSNAIVLAKKTIKPRMFVSVVGGPRKNIISSPFDPVYRTNPYSAFNVNYDISVQVGKAWTRAEIFTGVKYVYQEYKPKKVDEIVNEGSVRFVQSLNNNRYGLLSVPVGFNYNFVNRGRHHLYASVSGDANFVMRANYAVVIKEYGNSRGYTTSSALENSQLDRKPFVDPILEGGPILDNTFLSATVGLGYRYQLGNHFSVFSKGSYQHTIISEGIGPNKDKFYGISLGLGMRYDF